MRCIGNLERKGQMILRSPHYRCQFHTLHSWPHQLIKHNISTVCVRLLRNHPFTLHVNFYKSERQQGNRHLKLGAEGVKRLRMNNRCWKLTLALVGVLASAYTEGKNIYLHFHQFCEMHCNFNSNICIKIKKRY